MGIFGFAATEEAWLQEKYKKMFQAIDQDDGVSIKMILQDSDEEKKY